MNCHQMDTILDDHAVRSLSAAQRSEMDAHLATCARCSIAWLGYRVLAGDSPGEPRPELFGEVAAYVVADRPLMATRRFASWFGLAAAVLVVTVLASSSLFRYGAIPGTADAGRGPVGEAANSDAAGPKEALHIVAGQALPSAAYSRSNGFRREQDRGLRVLHIRLSALFFVRAQARGLASAPTRLRRARARAGDLQTDGNASRSGFLHSRSTRQAGRDADVVLRRDPRPR